MDFENIEKIIEYSKNKVGIIIVVLAGIFVPGILTIFLFWRQLFIELELIKLILLAISISFPSFLVLLMFTLIEHTGEQSYNYILEGLGLNILIFGIAIFTKIQLGDVIDIREFVKIIAFSSTFSVQLIHGFVKKMYSPKRIEKMVKKELDKMKKRDPEKYLELLNIVKNKENEK